MESEWAMFCAAIAEAAAQNCGAPPRREESVEVVRASGQDASWTSPWGGVSDMPIQEEILGQTRDMLEILYLSACLGTSW